MKNKKEEPTYIKEKTLNILVILFVLLFIILAYLLSYLLYEYDPNNIATTTEYIANTL